MRYRKSRRGVNVAGPRLVEALSRACLDFGFVVVVVRAKLVPTVVDAVVILRVVVNAGVGSGATASATKREEARSALDHGADVAFLHERSVGGQACRNDRSTGLDFGPERRVDSNGGLVLRGCNKDSVELEMRVVETHRGTDNAEDTQPENGGDLDLLGPLELELVDGPQRQAQDQEIQDDTDSENRQKRCGIVVVGILQLECGVPC